LRSFPKPFGIYHIILYQLFTYNPENFCSSFFLWNLDEQNEIADFVFILFALGYNFEMLTSVFCEDFQVLCHSF